jgi:hypothetical protein
MGLWSGRQHSFEKVVGDPHVGSPALQKFDLGWVDALVGTSDGYPWPKQALGGSGIWFGLKLVKRCREVAPNAVLEGLTQEGGVRDHGVLGYGPDRNLDLVVIDLSVNLRKV